MSGKRGGRTPGVAELIPDGLPEALRDYLDREGLSEETFAPTIGASRATVNNLITRRHPTSTIVRKVAIKIGFKVLPPPHILKIAEELQSLETNQGDDFKAITQWIRSSLNKGK